LLNDTCAPTYGVSTYLKWLGKFIPVNHAIHGRPADSQGGDNIFATKYSIGHLSALFSIWALINVNHLTNIKIR
jgi:hypothetical protein